MNRTRFSSQERRRQSDWKRGSPEFHLARHAGTWKGNPCDFILPVEQAELNLWAPIREEVVTYFRSSDVAWHDEENKDYGSRTEPGPSPHLLDSQVCALNFWWGLAQQPAALTAALRPLFPDLDAVVAFRPGEPLLVPEWIGLRNYLGERGWKRRGSRATSTDFLITYADASGSRHGILVESKYTESYEPDNWRRVSNRGTDRAATYRGEFEKWDGPFNRELDIGVEDLLIEPFDQHLRQQLLARAMEREGEADLRTVTCLHVAPRMNETFHRNVTAPKLAERAKTVGDSWRSILRDPSRYRSVAYEELFALIAGLRDPALDVWLAYQRVRYPWAEQ